MPQFTVTRTVRAPKSAVWQVLNQFGQISQWNSGVKASALTSEGPVGQDSTRVCDLTPFGKVNERIAHYEPETRLTVDIFEAFKLPIASAVADFQLQENADGTTTINIDYSYTLNRLGRFAKGTTDKQMRKGIGGLGDDLAAECERVAAHP